MSCRRFFYPLAHHNITLFIAFRHDLNPVCITGSVVHPRRHVSLAGVGVSTSYPRSLQTPFVHAGRQDKANRGTRQTRAQRQQKLQRNSKPHPCHAHQHHCERSIPVSIARPLS